jgi:hypothetical protein
MHLASHSDAKMHARYAMSTKDMSDHGPVEMELDVTAG